MKEVQEFNTLEELKHIVFEETRGYVLHGSTDIKVRKYGYGDGIDHRIGWDTYLVTLKGEPVGFTDGPVPE
jgi:hypothetical protein